MNSQRRHERLRSVLGCPDCKGPLQYQADAAVCAACARDFPIRKGRYYFVEPPRQEDTLDNLKGRLKRRLGRFYYSIGVTLLAPTFPFNFARQVRRRINPSEVLVVDAGCGNHRLHPEIICADLFDYAEVDVVCDLGQLPFMDGSVDAFLSRSVIEHIPQPEALISEFARATRENGWGFHLIPFLFPYHASPHDYRRYTHTGQITLFSGWSVETQFNATGPVTLFLVMLIEFLATLCGLGREKPTAFFYLFWCATLFWVKFLDFPFVGRKAFLGMAPTIFLAVRKQNATA